MPFHVVDAKEKILYSLVPKQKQDGEAQGAPMECYQRSKMERYITSWTELCDLTPDWIVT